MATTDECDGLRALNAELLAACEAALEFLKKQGYSEAYCDTHGHPVRRTLEAAIAKGCPLPDISVGPDAVVLGGDSMPSGDGFDL